MSAFHFTELFGIEDPRMMKMGLIAIDVDQESGYEKRDADKATISSTVQENLLLFPQGMIENDENQDNGTLFSKAWLNGFSWSCQINGVLDVKDVHKATSNWMKSRGVCTSDQLFATRSPQMMNTLFSCFRRFGSDTRLSPRSDLHKDKFNNFEEHGGLCRAWIDEPLAVRYAIRSCASKHGLDYFFMIAGSDLLMNCELLKEHCETLGQNLITCDEHMKKDPKAFKPYLAEISNYKVWLAYDNTSLAGCEDDTVRKMGAIKRSVVRTMIGVTYIHNYLLYARDVLGTEAFDLLEISESGAEVVDINDVIEDYRPVYRYFRNLALMTDMA